MKCQTIGVVLICFGFTAAANAGDFVELHDFNGFYGSPGVPKDAVEKLKERQGAKTTELKCVAFTPDGDWVALFGGNGVWTSNTGLPAVKKLSELWNVPHADFKCVAFAPSGGWAVLWGTNGHCSEGGIPKDAVEKIAEVEMSGGALRAITLAPRGGWVLLFDKTGVAYGDIPANLVKVLDNAVKNRLSVRCVAFAPGGDWICLTDNGWWTSNADLPAAKWIAANVKLGLSPKWVAFMPEDAGSGPCRLETKPTQSVVATLTTDIAHPDAKVDEWYLYAPQVPNLPGQRAVKTTFVPKGVVVREKSSLQRPVILTRIADGRREVRAVLTIEATLMSRRLRALAPGEKGPEVHDLSAEAFKNQTCPSATLDFTSKPFRDWMAGAALKREKGEADMAFARRAFAYIKHHFHYQGPTSAHTASQACAEGKSDCGGLSAVFVSTMRANGVPARLLGGRWAVSQKPGDRSLDCGQYHVKSEFFAHGVGWVPVDMSGAVGNTRGGDFAFFGNDQGDFIVMAAGHDLVLASFISGKQNTPLFQGIVYWWRGSGADKNSRFDEFWTVHSEKPHLGVR